MNSIKPKSYIEQSNQQEIFWHLVFSLVYFLWLFLYLLPWSYLNLTVELFIFIYFIFILFTSPHDFDNTLFFSGYKFSHRIVSYLTVSLDSILTKFEWVTNTNWLTKEFFTNDGFFYKNLNLSVVEYYYFILVPSTFVYHKILPTLDDTTRHLWSSFLIDFFFLS